MPILTRRVLAARAEAITRGDASTDRSFGKWIWRARPRVEAHLLGGLHLAERFLERRRLAHARRARKLREEAEFHATPALKFGISYA